MDQEICLFQPVPESAGIVVRACVQLLEAKETLSKCGVFISLSAQFVEIYDEKVSRTEPNRIEQIAIMITILLLYLAQYVVCAATVLSCSCYCHYFIPPQSLHVIEMSSRPSLLFFYVYPLVLSALLFDLPFFPSFLPFHLFSLSYSPVFSSLLPSHPSLS